MEVLEMRKLFTNSVRNLAMMMDQLVNDQADRAMIDDEVMQDHWANTHPIFTLHEETEVAECLEFLGRVHRALEDVVTQKMYSSHYFTWKEEDEALIAEMLVGFIGYKVDGTLAECARRVKQTADDVLAKVGKKKSKEQRNRLLGEFMDSIIPMVRDYGFELLDNEKNLELNGLYLMNWFKRKYSEH